MLIQTSYKKSDKVSHGACVGSSRCRALLYLIFIYTNSKKTRGPKQPTQWCNPGAAKGTLRPTQVQNGGGDGVDGG